MLPFGHIAAGYLVAEIFLHYSVVSFSPAEKILLLGIGAFFAFAPDLDMFFAFARVKGFTITDHKINHRQSWTHVPLFWLGFFVVGYLFAAPGWPQAAVLVAGLGTASHFLLDSYRMGLRWLFPFSKKYFALTAPGQYSYPAVKGFWKYWWAEVQQYRREAPALFYSEIILVLTALAVFFF